MGPPGVGRVTHTDADLSIIGFRGEQMRHDKEQLFAGYGEVGTILFVNTLREIDIDRVIEEVPGVPDANSDEDTPEKEKKDEVPENDEDGRETEEEHITN